MRASSEPSNHAQQCTTSTLWDSAQTATLARHLFFPSEWHSSSRKKFWDFFGARNFFFLSILTGALREKWASTRPYVWQDSDAKIAWKLQCSVFFLLLPFFFVENPKISHLLLNGFSLASIWKGLKKTRLRAKKKKILIQCPPGDFLLAVSLLQSILEWTDASSHQKPRFNSFA